MIILPLNLMASQRVNVLGVGISVLNLRTALDAIADAVRTRRKGYICVTGVHGVMEAQDDAAFKKILNGAFLCTPDGMPMVWAGKLNGHREMARVYGPDLMLDVCAWSEKNSCRHFFYGGADGVAALLADTGIVRNRLKVHAAVTNAKAFLAVRKEFGTFDAYIWSFVAGRPLQNARCELKDVPARIQQSDAMSKDLKKRGFTFVGTTICYAFMQATGMVNDHLLSCFRHAELS